ncbi:hypothetical protein DUNSADRAFT_2379 [Dunaliella salina]|uniref:Encoded protein n=1 Tax=Dunaliella salina TaxID=3046 RepID=A0ABQ7GVP6_DUNSA|nr:hypothetical protein DUNSADRAFT_2379 [Dunaliella salina]|eukprot:KAF5838684.1 hypothetical protein DUNSADRAFT_2379 [Dunaliella salina]
MPMNWALPDQESHHQSTCSTVLQKNQHFLAFPANPSASLPLCPCQSAHASSTFPFCTTLFHAATATTSPPNHFSALNTSKGGQRGFQHKPTSHATLALKPVTAMPQKSPAAA